MGLSLRDEPEFFEVTDTIRDTSLTYVFDRVYSGEQVHELLGDQGS